MRDMNKVLLVGRLGADPIRRETKNGTSVVQLSLATNYRKKIELVRSAPGGATSTDSGGNAGTGGADRANSAQPRSPGGDYDEITQWHRIIVWGKLGDTCADRLAKGAKIFVEGRIKSSRWSDSEKVNRTSFEIHADRINFLDASRFDFKRATADALAGEVVGHVADAGHAEGDGSSGGAGDTAERFSASAMSA